MKFLSVCSGIEAASVAWNPLGWKAAAFSEIEPFPCSVLAHHYPDVPNRGDMTKFKEWPDEPIDLLCGGTPCQSFSVAGLRKGLDDPRGNLMLTFGAIAAKYRPRWLVWENVPGVLSSNGGRDFGSFLGLLGVLGYGFAYRVLDAQYFGVAQRRRRVFVVGCLGDWRSAAAVLFERHSLQGHSAPSRSAGAGIAPSLTVGSGGSSGHRYAQAGMEGSLIAGTMKACKDSGGWSNSADHAAAGYMIPVETLCVATGQVGAEIGADMAPTLNCNHEAPYVAKPVGVTIHGTDKSVRVASFTDVAGCLRANVPGRVENSSSTVVAQPVPFDTTQITSAANYSNPKAGDHCHPLAAGMHAPAIAFPGRMSSTQCASSEELCPSLCAINPTAVAFNMHKSGNDASSMGISEERTDCLRAFEKAPFAVQPSAGMQVRRLTPRECERLQGFPDEYTLIPITKRQPIKGHPAVVKMAADGPRYKALGNSWAVPCARWIGERIAMVDALQVERREAA